jgi:hypothetical protein
VRRQAAQERGLDAKDEQHRAEEDRQPADAGDLDPGRRHQRDRAQRQPKQRGEGAGKDQAQMRRQQHEELEVAPAIAHRTQLARSDSPPVIDRHLDHGQAGPAGPNEHLGGELHAARPQAEFEHRLPAKSTIARLAVRKPSAGGQQ